MTFPIEWKTTEGTVNGQKAKKIEQLKNGKTIKSDIYIDFDNKDGYETKIYQDQNGSSFYRAISIFGVQVWAPLPYEIDGIFAPNKAQSIEENTNNNTLRTLEQGLTGDSQLATQAELQGGKTSVSSTTVEQFVKPEPPKTILYTVKKGEIFSLIAKRNGFTTKELEKLNRHIKNINDIKPGDKLNIPVKAETQNGDNLAVVKTTTSPAENSSIIEQSHKKSESKKQQPEIIICKLGKGETLGDLAKKYNVSISYIKEINGISEKEERRLCQGREIKIPKHNLVYTRDDKENIELLKTSVMNDEGLKLKAYKCPAGKWTIGYGHTAGVKKGQIISKQQAENYLKADLQKAYKDLKILLFEKGITDLDNGKKRALADLIFNVGVEKIRNSKLIKYIQEGKYEKAQAELDYFKAGGRVQAGLIKRRICGMKEFLGGTITPAAKNKVINAINSYLETNAKSWSEAINLLKTYNKNDIAIIMQECHTLASN